MYPSNAQPYYGGATTLSPKAEDSLKKHAKAEVRSRFTLKNILVNVLIITGLFSLNFAGFVGAAWCYGILFLMVFNSMEGAIKALSLSSLIIVVNPFMFDMNLIHTWLRFPLVAACGVRIFLEVIRRAPLALKQPHVKALLVFGGVAFISAALSPTTFLISFLKLGVFVYGAYFIMVATDMNRFSSSDLTVWFAAMVLFFIAGNLFAYFSGIGFTFRGRLMDAGMGLGLAGMTNHPQTLGPLSAISFVYAICIVLFTPYRMRWLMLAASPVLLAFSYMSAARTGLFASLLTLAILLWMTFLLGNGPRRVRLNISLSQLAIYLFLGLCGLFVFEVVSGGVISQRFAEFALKAVRTGSGGIQDLTFDRVFETRMPLIEMSMYGFRQAPVFGIGFGTSLDPRWILEATIFTAPTEKGFLPAAILEEVGIVGTIAFVVFMVLFYRNFWRQRNIVALGVMTCFLLLNMGEMMFFALGGMGLYCWSMVGASIALGSRVVEKQRPHR